MGKYLLLLILSALIIMNTVVLSGCSNQTAENNGPPAININYLVNSLNEYYSEDNIVDPRL
jgi:hypothetical protein